MLFSCFRLCSRLDFETGQSKISYVPIAHPARLGDADLQEAVAQAASGASRKWRKPQVERLSRNHQLVNLVDDPFPNSSEFPRLNL